MKTKLSLSNEEITLLVNSISSFLSRGIMDVNVMRFKDVLSCIDGSVDCSAKLSGYICGIIIKVVLSNPELSESELETVAGIIYKLMYDVDYGKESAPRNLLKQCVFCLSKVWYVLYGFTDRHYKSMHIPRSEFYNFAMDSDWDVHKFKEAYKSSYQELEIGEKTIAMVCALERIADVPLLFKSTQTLAFAEDVYRISDSGHWAIKDTVFEVDEDKYKREDGAIIYPGGEEYQRCENTLQLVNLIKKDFSEVSEVHFHLSKAVGRVFISNDGKSLWVL